jgi:hypothetical protein
MPAITGELRPSTYTTALWLHSVLPAGIIVVPGMDMFFVLALPAALYHSPDLRPSVLPLIALPGTSPRKGRGEGRLPLAMAPVLKLCDWRNQR